MYSIDIDIGGTFTDGFFTDGASVRTAKVLTTPHDITEGLMNCVEAGGEAFEMGLGDFLRRSSVARVSTTVGTNLLVQRAGPRLGLIVTKGQERSLYGKGRATVLERFVSPDMVAGVREAVDAAFESGTVLKILPGLGPYEASILLDRGMAIHFEGVDDGSGAPVVIDGGSSAALDIRSSLGASNVLVRNLTLAGAWGVISQVPTTVENATHMQTNRFFKRRES